MGGRHPQTHRARPEKRRRDQPEAPRATASPRHRHRPAPDQTVVRAACAIRASRRGAPHQQVLLQDALYRLRRHQPLRPQRRLLVVRPDEDHRGQPRDLEGGGEVRVLVHVELQDVNLVAHLLRDLVGVCVGGVEGVGRCG